MDDEKKRKSLWLYNNQLTIFLHNQELYFCNSKCLLLFSNHFFHIQGNNKRRDKRKSCCQVVYTWKNRQPSSVKGDPNRVTRQARIFTSVLESNVGQEEDLDLFIRGVYTCRLREAKEGGRREEPKGSREKGGGVQWEGRGVIKEKRKRKGEKKLKKIKPKVPREQQNWETVLSVKKKSINQ